MKRNLFLVLIILLIAAVSLPVWSNERNQRTERQEVDFVVRNPNHDQALGGKSQRARIGLENAAAHSRAIIMVNRESQGDSKKTDPNSKK